MAEAVTPLWLTLALPFAGFLAATGTEYLRWRWQTTGERRGKEIERQRARVDRREEFEVRTLTELNVALNKLGRASMQAHVLDLKNAKVSGRYASHLIEDDEIGERQRVAAFEVSSLSGLVLDDVLRYQIEAARNALLTPTGMLDSDVDEAERAMDTAVALLGAARDGIAARLREIYLGEA